MEKIDMVLNKESMYKLIWLDYFDRSKDDKDQCFIYNYMKKNKDLRCEKLSSDASALSSYGDQKRFDKYIMLKSSRLAYLNNVIDKDKFTEIFKAITKQDISADADNDILEELSVKQEDKLLWGCVSDFFQNSGYRFKKKESGEKSNKKKDRSEKEWADGEYDKVEVKYTKKQDGYISDLDMWADFYLYEKSKGNTVSGSLDNVVINDEYIKKCEKLYTELLAEEQCDVFVPLCFDAKSGAGIYIIGRNKIANTVSVPKDKDCYIFVSCFFYVDSCDYDNEELLLSMQFTCVNSVRSAFDSLRKGGTVFFQHYPCENTSMPAEADECFEVFFDSTVPSRTKALIQKQLERENADLESDRTFKHKNGYYRQQMLYDN